MNTNVLNYLDEYGTRSLDDYPFCDVDSLILCQLSYLKFDGLVPDVRESMHSVSLEEVNHHPNREALFADKRFENNNRPLFDKVTASVRFGSMRLCCYINLVEQESQMQFSAITFLLPDDTIYIAFRGTDETITGWKEDFNMAFLKPIPGQELSARYLNMVTGGINARFYVGGHSKGGNLAIYSAMRCKEYVRDRIIKIYSMDGPGLRPELLESLDYESVRDRIVKYLPQGSIIGMLFDNRMPALIVKSSGVGILQHDPFTWEIADGRFIYTDQIDRTRAKEDEILNRWVLSLSQEELQIFVDTLYKVIMSAETDSLIDFSKNKKKSMMSMISSLNGIDEKTKKQMQKTIRSLLVLAEDEVKKSALRRLFSWIH